MKHIDGSYVVVDCEHGHLGWDTAIQHIRAAARSNTCVFIRISTVSRFSLHSSYVRALRLCRNEAAIATPPKGAWRFHHSIA